MNVNQFIAKYPPLKVERYNIGFGDIIELTYSTGHINVREDGWQVVKLTGGVPFSYAVDNSLCIFRGSLGLIDNPFNWFRSPWQRCAKHLGLTQ